MFLPKSVCVPVNKISSESLGSFYSGLQKELPGCTSTQLKMANAANCKRSITLSIFFGVVVAKTDLQLILEHCQTVQVCFSVCLLVC